LVRAKLPRHFGEGSLYGPRHKALTVPQWIFDSFADWQTIMQLQSAENKKILREIAATAQRRHQLEALLALTASNYGLKMFDIVEGAKRTLSDKRGAEIALEGPGFNVREFVTRGEFEGIIRGETRTIEHHLLETVRQSGLRPDQIDTVIRTGGSALIPAFQELLGRHFGEAKVRGIDAFSSVTAGLGVTGHHLERGEIDLPALTPADFAALPPATGGRLQVKPVNVELMQRRIRLAERGDGSAGELRGRGAGEEEERALVLLGQASTGERVYAELAAVMETTGGKWQIASGKSSPQVLGLEQGTPSEEDSAVGSQRLAVSGLSSVVSGPVISALRVAADAQILLITSRYRFLLITARQLADMREVGLDIENIYRFAAREAVAAVVDWSAAREMERLLLVTSTGYARAYPIDSLRAAIEGPVPFGFDNPPPGVPVLAQGIRREWDVVVVTTGGRGVRWPLSKLPLTGLQAINPGRDEAFDRVNTALAIEPAGEIVLLLADGYARRLRVEWVEEAPKANAKGKALVARRVAVVGLAPVGALEVVTDRRRLTADGSALTVENGTKTFRLVRLEDGESVTAVVRD
jgi:DNA gyrase/topoisomerase IV subunit A